MKTQECKRNDAEFSYPFYPDIGTKYCDSPLQSVNDKLKMTGCLHTIFIWLKDGSLHIKNNHKYGKRRFSFREHYQKI